MVHAPGCDTVPGAVSCFPGAAQTAGSATLVTSDNRLRPHKPQTLEAALRYTQEVTQGHVLKKRVPVQTTCFAPQSLLSPETNLGVPGPIHFL